jgi:hypothetical protein
MKRISIIKKGLLVACLFFAAMTNSFAQEEKEDEGPQPVIRLQYFNNNNKLQYLLLHSQLKKGKVFTPQANKSYSLYLDSADQQYLVGNLKTNNDGKAKTFINPSLKEKWNASSSHVFILKEGDEEIISDFTINKSKINIDTVNTDGARSIVATVTRLQDEEWIPVPDVELKVGVQRLGGILSAGEEDMYTTDSTGAVTVELSKPGIPGDAKGNYSLAVRVEDHETLGNLLFEQTVPWGNRSVAEKGFFEQRTLWSTRFRTPLWLLLMAYTIVIGVWGTLLYLIWQLYKIKKIGNGVKEHNIAASPGNTVPG